MALYAPATSSRTIWPRRTEVHFPCPLSHSAAGPVFRVHIGPQVTKQHPAPWQESEFVPGSQLTCFEKGGWWLERLLVWSMVSVAPSCLMVKMRFFSVAKPGILHLCWGRPLNTFCIPIELVGEVIDGDRGWPLSSGLVHGALPGVVTLLMKYDNYLQWHFPAYGTERWWARFVSLWIKSYVGKGFSWTFV